MLLPWLRLAYVTVSDQRAFQAGGKSAVVRVSFAAYVTISILIAIKRFTHIAVDLMFEDLFAVYVMPFAE